MLIILAGMIGAGKSTIARQVSERLAIPFHGIDQDKIEVFESMVTRSLFGNINASRNSA